MKEKEVGEEKKSKGKERE